MFIPYKMSWSEGCLNAEQRPWLKIADNYTFPTRLSICFYRKSIFFFIENILCKINNMSIAERWLLARIWFLRRENRRIFELSGKTVIGMEK